MALVSAEKMKSSVSKVAFGRLIGGLLMRDLNSVPLSLSFPSVLIKLMSALHTFAVCVLPKCGYVGGFFSFGPRHLLIVIRWNLLLCFVFIFNVRPRRMDSSCCFTSLYFGF